MSAKGWEARTWSHTVPVDSAAERAVLVSYAWRAGVKLVAWPGLDQLVEDTGHYRETISIARRALVAHGYLIDTGERRGKSGRVAVYRLNLNQRQKPPIAPVDNPSQSAAKAAHCGDEISGFSRTDARLFPQTIPITDFEPMNEQVQRASARELVQGAEALQPEQVQRTEGMRKLDAIFKQLPNLNPRKARP